MTSPPGLVEPAGEQHAGASGRRPHLARARRSFRAFGTTLPGKKIGLFPSEVSLNASLKWANIPEHIIAAAVAKSFPTSPPPFYAEAPAVKESDLSCMKMTSSPPRLQMRKVRGYRHRAS
jgi:hypothetical protein